MEIPSLIPTLPHVMTAGGLTSGWRRRTRGPSGIGFRRLLGSRQFPRVAKRQHSAGKQQRETVYPPAQIFQPQGITEGRNPLEVFEIPGHQRNAFADGGGGDECVGLSDRLTGAVEVTEYVAEYFCSLNI